MLNQWSDPSEKQPDENSPFWRGYECWASQGKKVNVVGGGKTWCVFETELMRKRREGKERWYG